MDVPPADFTALLATIADRLKAIHKVLDDLCRSVGARDEREREESKKETKVSAEIRFPELVERDRASQQKKQHRTQKIIAAGTWAAFVAASIYAGLAARQLIQMRKATTAATQANIDAQDRFRKDERPYIWLSANGFGHPEVSPTGQIVWTYHFTVYGKSPAFNVRSRRYISVDGGPFVESYGAPQQSIPSGGAPLPPGEDILSSVISAPGITRQNFLTDMRKSKAVRIKFVFEYTDVEGSPYESGVCLQTLNTGAVSYCTDDAYNDNYMK